MSLKTELGKRLLTDMIKVAKGDDPAIVLVVDPHTSKILSSCLRMYDLMEAGVLVLQNLLLAREKLPDLPAIYFIDPTTECVEQVIKDFPAGCVSGAAAASAKQAQRAQYLNAHLFFTSHVPSASMGLIKASSMMKKIKSFVELNVDFLAFESRVFVFDQPHTIPRLYFPAERSKLSLTLSAISKPLVSLCITLQEMPYVRYADSSLCKGLASFFEMDLKKTLSQLDRLTVNEKRERGTLLIVDRAIDPIAPLVHEYTFQAMVNDVLKVKGEIAYLPVSAKGANGLPKPKSELEADKAAAELVLSEDDSLWLDFRHKHIGSVMTDVTAKFKEFKGVNKMAVLQQDDKSNVKDMIQAMKDMPEYKNMMKKYHKHMSLAKECMDRFDTGKLQALGQLEQDLSTGLDDEANSIKIKDVIDRLVKLCQDPSVGVLEKLRLMMVYIISQGAMQDATRRELLKSVDVDLQDAIRNLENLGVDLSKSDKKRKMAKERMEELKAHSKDQQLGLMRYLPVLHGVIEQLVNGSLKEDAYPYTSPPPPGSQPSAASSGGARKGVSARKRQNTGNSDWKSGEAASSSTGSVSSSSSPSTDEDLRPRFLVFVLGGLTFSEMRSAYEIAEKQGVNLYIGSTHTLTPKEFVQDLSNLEHEHFKQAVKNSGGGQAASSSSGAASSSSASNGRGAAAASSSSSSSAPLVGGASSKAAAPAARRPIQDSDSDDDEPVNMRKVKITV